ncbi:DUF4062 domain-containing protein [Bacillus mycoides]|uniref:DUF4062 domain-containing protein n=1 Tax=Bacillus mycoides TaxID=1405 RepID=UPI00382B1494
MNKPRIFVSSTIYDFRDLRSSLKYFLEEFGFEVEMSEFNDFEKEISENSYDACLKTIEGCDYYLLLIGSRVGGFYDKTNKISITQKEYRHAYKLSQTTKGLKLLNFVRRDIWDLINDISKLKQYLTKEYIIEKNILSKEDVTKITEYKHKDANFISDFIKEVARADEMKEAISGSGPYPKNNWIHQFDNFEDIIKVLTTQLNINKNIDYSIHSTMVSKEILFNFKHLTRKINGVNTSCLDFNDKCFDELERKLKSFSNNHIDKLCLTDHCVQNMLMYSNYFLNIGENLSIAQTEKAIQSGTFLEFDNDRHKFKTSKVLDYMIMLREIITNSNIHTLSSNEIIKKLNTTKKNPDGEYEQQHIDVLLHALIISAFHQNIFELCKVIYNYFQTGLLSVPNLTKRFLNANTISTQLTEEELLNLIE